MAAIQKAKLESAATFNHKLASYLGLTLKDDYEHGLIGENLYAVDDTLETMLSVDWPDLLDTRRIVIAEGDGPDNEKHEATYRLAAQRCGSAPHGAIVEIVEAANRLAI